MHSLRITLKSRAETAAAAITHNISMRSRLLVLLLDDPSR